MRKRFVIGLTLTCIVLGAGAGAALIYTDVVSASVPSPDLIVDQASLRQHWVIRSEFLRPEFCSVQEGEVTPGERLLLRFTVATPNIGDADLAIGDPNEHFEAGDGLFEFASCHNHFHFRHYALYELVDPRTGRVWRASKRGFCMIDIVKYRQYEGEMDNRRHFASCGAIGIPGNQGISRGWSDVYVWKLGGQYFVLDGGDGQAPVPPGQYLIRITVNPPFVAAPGEPCPNVDGLGFCHQLPESDYNNNIAQVSITLPDHLGRQSVGPLKNEPVLTSEPDDCHVK